MKEDWEKLTTEEKAFVLRVSYSNGAKYGASPSYNDDGDFWTEPENKGFIECTGSYKWVATKKFKDYLNKVLGINLTSY